MEWKTRHVLLPERFAVWPRSATAPESSCEWVQRSRKDAVVCARRIDAVAEAREHTEVLAGKGISEIADYEEGIIRRLNRKAVIIGHSFGGLLTMILAGRRLAAASVAISPAPFRGVLPLPVPALRTASVALRNPANWNRAVPLSCRAIPLQRR